MTIKGMEPLNEIVEYLDTRNKQYVWVRYMYPYRNEFIDPNHEQPDSDCIDIDAILNAEIARYAPSNIEDYPEIKSIKAKGEKEITYNGLMLYERPVGMETTAIDTEGQLSKLYDDINKELAETVGDGITDGIGYFTIERHPPTKHGPIGLCLKNGFMGKQEREEQEATSRYIADRIKNGIEDKDFKVICKQEGVRMSERRIRQAMAYGQLPIKEKAKMKKQLKEKEKMNEAHSFVKADAAPYSVSAFAKALGEIIEVLDKIIKEKEKMGEIGIQGPELLDSLRSTKKEISDDERT